MDYQLIKPGKKVSRRVIVFVIAALSPVILWGLLLLLLQLSYLPIRVEIARIASASGIKPLSIECSTGIDTGTQCDVLYNRLTYDEQLKMLTNTGYTIDATPDDGSNYISATNSKVHMYVGGGPGYEGSRHEGKTTFTFQLNDYRN